MTEAEKRISRIGTGMRNERYGDMQDSTVNGMYKKYAAWTKINEPNKNVLSFKQWVTWAKSKDIIKNYNAEGSDNNKSEAGAVTYQVGKPNTNKKEQVPEIVKNTGKNIAKFLIIITVIGIGVSLINFSKPAGSDSLGEGIPA